MPAAPLRVLIVGCGHMGAAHARAYRALDGFEIAGVVARRAGVREALAQELGGCPVFADAAEALAATRPDAVCVSTYPDTHAALAIAALEAGAHVFVEKPLADAWEPAQAIVAAAREAGRALVVGYILRHHPAWVRFIEHAHDLGRPLVMRISQNQQSLGAHWSTQRSLLASVSPLVDCGVHYVDVFCQMAGTRAVQVQAVGARLAPDLPPGRHNYGQLQILFEDGSVAWYEAGWGPMMSREADFIKDVIGPEGSVTLAQRTVREAGGTRQSATFLRHRSALDAQGGLAQPDEVLAVPEEPSLHDLCTAEQRFFLDAILTGRDLRAHHAAALESLRIVLGAERSIRERRAVDL
jgi:predicted dehydrogenase